MLQCKCNPQLFTHKWLQSVGYRTRNWHTSPSRLCHRCYNHNLMSTVMNNSKDNLQNRIYVSFDEQKVEWKLVVKFARSPRMSSGQSRQQDCMLSLIRQRPTKECVVFSSLHNMWMTRKLFCFCRVTKWTICWLHTSLLCWLQWINRRNLQH